MVRHGAGLMRTQREPASITLDDVHAARDRIAGAVTRTPLIRLEGSHLELYLKLETLQPIRSFKARGAFANLLLRDVPAAGVVAASGGNHGAAVAFAASKLGKPARIFVPRVASPAKMDRIRGYGAELVIAGDLYVDALSASQEWAQRSGAMQIHAYDQIETLLGQGSGGKLPTYVPLPAGDSVSVTCE